MLFSPTNHIFQFRYASFPSLETITMRIPTRSNELIGIKLDIVESIISILFGQDILDRVKLVAENVKMFSFAREVTGSSPSLTKKVIKT